MSSSRLLGAAFAVFSLNACITQVGDARVGTPRPPREPACSLNVVSPTDMKTMMTYEQVGMVRLSNEQAGTDPLAASSRAIVRPRACALGGEAISILASGDVTRSLHETAYATYIVWAKKNASSAPQKF